MHQSTDEPEWLDLLSAENLLREQGYNMTCRFGHIHATTGADELHICLIADLAAMSPSHFLALLHEASRHSLQYIYP